MPGHQPVRIFQNIYGPSSFHHTGVGHALLSIKDSDQALQTG